MNTQSPTERKAFAYKALVMHMKTKQILTLLLAALMTTGALASCGGDDTAAVDTADTASATAAETENPDPFAALDFGGEKIHFYVNANDYYGSGSSNYLIKHDEDTTGDIVNEAVYKRNTFVEELLNIEMVFEDCDYAYSEITEPLTNTIAAGDDIYDVVVHDLMPMANMSVSGYFMNVVDGKYFDFTQDYWYDDYMADLSFASTEKNYLLAGDFFLDIIRSAHALYVNKELFLEYYESTEELYDHVNNMTWTQEVFQSYIKDVYQDVNGDGKADDGDIYGYGYVGKWGSAFPWISSSNIQHLAYESDGAPYFAFNNERSVKLLERLNDIFYDTSAHDYVGVDTNTNAFMSGTVLFGGYQRIASFEIFRDMETEIGIIPYPMFDEAQGEYVTSTHDITTIGVIPITCNKLDTVSAVLEVLARETYNTVMPAYYETALKVKYSRDDQSSQMLDIIRAGLGKSFPLAYNSYCDYFPMSATFASPLGSHKTDFVSFYEKGEKAAQAKLDALWAAFSSIEQ